MSKTFKRFGSLFLALMMLFSMLPINAFAAENETAPVAETTNVAKIGGTEYATLQAAINAVADGQTITLLKDCADNATLNASGKNITIDGNGKTYTGKISLTKGDGRTITVKNATLSPAGTFSIHALDSTAYWNIVVDDCVCISQTDCWNSSVSYGVVYGTQCANTAITIKNSEISGFYYTAAFSQSGKGLIVENCNITDCVYLVSAGKCDAVTIKGVTYSGEGGMLMKGEGYAKTLKLEDTSIKITNATYPYNLVYVVADTSLVTANITGVNQFVDAAGTAYTDLTWTNLPAAKLNIEAQNGTKFGSLAAIAADAVKNGGTVILLKDIDATIELPYGITLDKNGFKADNVTVAKPDFTVMIGEQGYETLADAFAEANKAAGDYTITLLTDNAEEFTFAQNAGVNITVDGNGKTFTGKITLDAGAGSLTFKNATLTPSNADAKSIVLNAATAPDITIDGCTLKNTGTKGAIVWGLASSTANKVVIKNSTASNLLYLVGTNQAGCEDVTIENVTATNMGYLIRPMKAVKVTVKDVTYSGLTFIQVKNSVASTLAIENVTVTTTQAGMPPVTMYAPDAGNVTVNYIITLKGENVVNGAEMTPATENAWFATGADGLLYAIKDLNRKPSGEVAYRADVTDKADREGIAILLKGVYAKESVVVKVYNNDTLMFTCTRRDIDDEGKVMFPVDGNTTANIVLWGKESGSWINEILVKPNELNVPNKIEVWADGVLVSTYTHESGTVLGVNLDKYLALDVVQQPVAKVGTKTYKTLQAAVDACPAGGKVTLLRNAKGPGVVINKNITINFNGKTYYVNKGVGSTGTESNGFQILAGNKVTLSGGTLKVAEEAADKFYILIQNYADLSCFNMNLDGTNLDKWSKTDGDSYVLSNNSGYISLTGKTYITTNNDGDKAFAFDACDSKYYADKPVVFAASTVKINGKAVSESYDKIEAAARIGSTQFFASLKEAFAYASSGNTIKLMADIAVSDGITNTKKVTLDLNGKTITGTDNATGSFAIITNKGQLTITGNGKITLTATNNRGWNAYSSVISNTVGGKLIVESGTIQHLGGTDMAYGIDNLTNGKGTYAETIINGGTIKSTYRAIRMFLNGIEAQNILTVNGGVIEGANKSIWMQDPSKNANTGNLTVTKGATLNGDVYLTVTAGSTQWPVEVSIAASAVNGEVLTSNVPAGYKLVNNKGVYSVEKVKVYVAKVGVTQYETLQAAIDACPDYGKVTLLRDAQGPGVVINKNITILFNGHTYTITEPVGSAGTETLGFQILKGNKVVLNNGKIEIAEEAADKFAILIQNYADLTVYQMTLDGTNLGRYENYSYVLSVNCGKVTVNGKSVLTAKDGEGNYALDVYDYSAAGYSLPTVTVTSVVKINGKISAGAKYSTVYYATVEQAKAANPGKNVTVLN